MYCIRLQFNSNQYEIEKEKEIEKVSISKYINNKG